ncbi:uncharacterized protein N7477_009508 [Penicillium maclennaniae]|uniref:uncharacterized protein n=1 Tax=Penicillium maclennaniae TaxID=1343394 RepID=UPI002540F88B|nr:uncharacterized protein N7477_009508 [Penicillium maclennaniae]KAJ5661892.1 hypothetical protein N7477_009508 [Penicillium maclennaniae]
MEDPSAKAQIIPLDRMPQQAGVRRAQDDWTGIVNRTERRKLQNRLNQRRYRLRRQNNQAESHAVVTTATSSGASSSSSSIVMLPPDVQAGSEEVFECAHAPPNALQFRERFMQLAYQSYIQGSPNRDHLISLSRLNVHQAINENIAAIGMTTAWMQSDESISIFNLQQPSFSIEKIPPCLRPTSLQLRIPHHPWLDFFPFPNMRDCMILAGDAFDDDDLCHDLMAFWDTKNTAATLLVWGNSWEAKNWEVTEAFAHKWKWLLRDSPELLASTNFWRKSRGEKPITWKYILSDP